MYRNTCSAIQFFPTKEGNVKMYFPDFTNEGNLLRNANLEQKKGIREMIHYNAYDTHTSII